MEQIDKRTAILYEGFEILKSLAMHCFERPFTPNEARALDLINAFDEIQNQERSKELEKGHIPWECRQAALDAKHKK